MTVNNEQGASAQAQEIMEHLLSGGTVSSFLKLTDDELEAIYAVGYNQFTARKFTKAINLFKFLCTCDHLEPRWYYSLGVAQQAKGDYDDAVRSFAVAVLFDSSDPKPQAQAGYCMMALGQKDDAKAALESAVNACGDNPLHAETKQQAEALLEALKAKGDKA